MTARWANPGVDSPDVLERVQSSLTVDMVMTPHSHLRTCRREETASAVMGRNIERFSFLPVVDEAGRFLGLYRAERWFWKEAPPEQIGNDFEPFSEDVVIGADASIIDFVKTADERQTRLVVSGDRVAGAGGFIGKARLEGGAGHRAVVFPAAGHDRTLGEHPADGNRKPNMSSNRGQRDKPYRELASETNSRETGCTASLFNDLRLSLAAPC